MPLRVGELIKLGLVTCHICACQPHQLLSYRLTDKRRAVWLLWLSAPSLINFNSSISTLTEALIIGQPITAHHLTASVCKQRSHTRRLASIIDG